MPELPEVETIRRDLESELIGLKFTNVDFFWTGSIKGVTPPVFKKSIIGKSIVAVVRRAKNLAIKLSSGQYILMHMKMTGHLLIEKGNQKLDKDGGWNEKSGPLADPQNQYIRVVFWLNNGNMLAFSDLRKFGYIKLVTQKELYDGFGLYGPEPFTKEFSVEYLTGVFSKKKQAIKKVIMDQSIIAGIGNIYADEILWETKINPQLPANKLTKAQIKNIHKTTADILKTAVKLRGTSTSDYRDTKGLRGNYESQLRAYRQTGKPCQRCHAAIIRIDLGGRGTHFCPNCQRMEQK
jgi:formamidopyrimidine-DNA glycosylase